MLFGAWLFDEKLCVCVSFIKKKSFYNLISRPTTDIIYNRNGHGNGSANFYRLKLKFESLKLVKSILI